jgi:hypothetical protein
MAARRNVARGALVVVLQQLCITSHGGTAVHESGLIFVDMVILQLLNNSGQTWAAVQAATQAVSLSPTWGDAWLTLARCQVCKHSL